MSSDGRTGEQLESDKVDQKADSCVTRAEVNVTEQDRSKSLCDSKKDKTEECENKNLKSGENKEENKKDRKEESKKDSIEENKDNKEEIKKEVHTKQENKDIKYKAVVDDKKQEADKIATNNSDVNSGSDQKFIDNNENTSDVVEESSNEGNEDRHVDETSEGNEKEKNEVEEQLTTSVSENNEINDNEKTEVEKSEASKEHEEDMNCENINGVDSKDRMTHEEAENKCDDEKDISDTEKRRHDSSELENEFPASADQKPDETQHFTREALNGENEEPRQTGMETSKEEAMAETTSAGEGRHQKMDVVPTSFVSIPHLSPSPHTHKFIFHSSI